MRLANTSRSQGGEFAQQQQQQQVNAINDNPEAGGIAGLKVEDGTEQQQLPHTTPPVVASVTPTLVLPTGQAAPQIDDSTGIDHSKSEHQVRPRYSLTLGHR